MASPTGQVGTARYTKQQVLLVSAEVDAVIGVIAREQGLTKAAVTRALLHAGLRAAGYDDVRTTDEPTNLAAIEQLNKDRSTYK